jgi:TonB family protein
MSWLHYLLEANIYLAVFYLLYFVLLDKETHYKLNRIYLLATCVLSYLIPLIQIGALRSYMDGGQVITIITNPNFKPIDTTGIFHFTLQGSLLYAYILGTAAMLVIFTFKIIQLIKLTRAQKNVLDDKYKLVTVKDSNTAFSFFNYVFIGTNVSGADTIIRHELVHINQKHSFDIVFLELIKIINWFNPFIYLLQRSLKTVHEYIADEQTAAYENDALTYSSFLVNNAYGISGSSITHSFFNYNLLKKRIIMLNQKRSGNLARLKYLAVIPVCGGLLCMSTLAFSKTYGWVNILPANNLLSLQIPVTKNPDVLKSKNVDTLRLKLDTDKKVPPPPPPVPPKNAKSGDMIRVTDVKRSQASAKNTKSPDVVRVKLSAPSTFSTGVKSEDPVAITNIKLAQASATSDKKIKIADARVKAEEAQQKIPPPPPPAMKPLSPFEALSKYVAKYTRYPTRAFKNNLAGSVIVQFTVTNEHKLADISILKGIGSGCDEEVKRAATAFPGTVNATVGTYKLAVTYYLKGLEPPKTASVDLFEKDPSFAGEIIIIGYPSK